MTDNGTAGRAAEQRPESGPAGVGDGSPHSTTEPAPAVAAARRSLATGETQEAAASFAALLVEAERLGLDEQRAAATLGLGECALDAGDLPVARAHFEEAERLLADAPPARRAPAVRGQAIVHLLTGELRYSCYLVENAIEQINASGQRDPGALLLLHTASIGPYMDMGAHARAAQAGELALALAPKVSDPELIAGMHRQVARTLIAAGRTAEADASLAKASEIYQRLGIRTEMAHCHWMRGYVRAQDGDLPGAESELRTARSMLASKRAALYTAQVEVELADVLRRQGKGAEAEELLLRLLGELHPERGSVHAGGAHRLLGLIRAESGDVDAAEEHYVTALALLERAGAAGDLADICRLLGDLLRRAGRTEAALDAYRTGLGHRAAPGSTTLGPAPVHPRSMLGAVGGPAD
ncbi:lipopolysaccharide assembly protein LapB [uncultured Streptomyces sp.]|uniref:tetratricopeptide repeat protein n=1 Tax=uncultured Streptomyces sp. TaxID=174707 RepID=UPI002612711A|nr:tetratricopeptide repeat protein [uncultured Streptomyces sp.]